MMRASVPLLCCLNILATKLLCNKKESSGTINYILKAKGLIRAHVLKERLWLHVHREGPGRDLPAEMSWE